MSRSKPKPTASDRTKGTKRSTRLLIILAGALSLIALTIALTNGYLRRAQLPLETYRSTELGFSLQIPAGWEAREASEYQQVAFGPAQKEAHGSSPQPGIAVSRNQPTDTTNTAEPDKYFSQLQATLKLSLAPQDTTSQTSLERYRELGQTREMIGKHPALIVRVAVDNLGHQTGTGGQGIIAYVYVSPQRQYVLAATAPASATAFAAQQQQLISTFRTLE